MQYNRISTSFECVYVGVGVRAPLGARSRHHQCTSAINDTSQVGCRPAARKAWPYNVLLGRSLFGVLGVAGFTRQLKPE